MRIVLCSALLAWSTALADELPVLPKGKRPETFRELREILKPLGFEVNAVQSAHRRTSRVLELGAMVFSYDEPHR